MKNISRFVACSAFVLTACATGEPLSLDAFNALNHQNPPDAGTTPQGGEGGADTTESGGAPSMGGTMTAAGGASAGAPSAGAPASGGAATNGGAVNGSGGMPAMSGGTGSGTGGAAGAATGCDTGKKMCGGACVVETAANGCSAASCTACPIPAPANGLQICDAQGQCNFECLSGFQKNGNQCTRGTGSGGAGGTSGGGGAGGALMCGTHNCNSCLGNLIACCDKGGKLCLCVLQNATNLCGP